jgi:hypothetical protein
MTRLDGALPGRTGGLVAAARGDEAHAVPLVLEDAVLSPAAVLALVLGGGKRRCVMDDEVADGVIWKYRYGRNHAVGLRLREGGVHHVAGREDGWQVTRGAVVLDVQTEPALHIRIWFAGLEVDPPPKVPVPTATAWLP